MFNKNEKLAKLISEKIDAPERQWTSFPGDFKNKLNHLGKDSDF